VPGALRLSRAFHAATVLLLIAVGFEGGLGWAYAGGVAAVAALLAYEQSLVHADDLSRVDVAFFTLNGMVSLAFMAAVAMETLL
jgi:4-hydroxybenzoate polyprenyltransferase